MQDVRAKKTVIVEERRRVYAEICSSFQPVLREFFSEFSSDAASWVRSRRLYAMSLAVTSMVSYVLGIGDRHAQNLLLDCGREHTGELVHIDFGVSFEQGWLLPTPEIVPFRLSRDMVDGLGPLGLEGLFKRHLLLLLLFAFRIFSISLHLYRKDYYRIHFRKDQSFWILLSIILITFFIYFLYF